MEIILSSSYKPGTLIQIKGKVWVVEKKLQDLHKFPQGAGTSKFKLNSVQENLSPKQIREINRKFLSQTSNKPI